MIERLCVIGVGLIGGSIASAARARNLCREIVGVDHSPDNLMKAQELGAIDAGYDDVREAARAADFVVIATPVGSFRSIFDALRLVWRAETIYTDAGSTKLSVVNAARDVFGAVPSNFVPGHPIAGAEQSGVEAAFRDLYVDKRVILTPLADTSVEAMAAVSSFWNSIGAKVSEMDAAHHDQVLAATSHLPHVLAYAMVHLLGKKDEKEEIFQYAAGGFRDFTRIASSDPLMWLDICLANRGEIAPLIHQLKDELDTVLTMLEGKGSAELLAFFSCARQARQRFLDLSESN
jgi:prephenate dehydrogenase